MTGWERKSTGNKERERIFIKLTNGIHRSQNISLKLKYKKILWDFMIQMNHLIQARRLAALFIKKEKKNRWYCGFFYASILENKIKKKSELLYKYIDLTNELKKQWNNKVTEIPTVVGVIETVLKKL